MTALIFVPIFIGLSVALTVIVADLLTPAEKSEPVAKKRGENRPVNA
ncbi:MAG: hypothetical protein WBX25_07960 [Rhodomicrobium sp.]